MFKITIKCFFVLLVCGVLCGCMSAYNHNRVKNNMLEDMILTSGTKEQKRLIARGVDAENAIKISAMNQDGAVNGVSVMLDVRKAGSYFSTYAEAPLSSSASLLLDAGAVYFLGTALLTELESTDSNNEEKTATDIKVEGGDGSTVVINTVNGYDTDLNIDGNKDADSSTKND